MELKGIIDDCYTYSRVIELWHDMHRYAVLTCIACKNPKSLTEDFSKTQRGFTRDVGSTCKACAKENVKETQFKAKPGKEKRGKARPCRAKQAKPSALRLLAFG